MPRHKHLGLDASVVPIVYRVVAVFTDTNREEQFATATHTCLSSEIEDAVGRVRQALTSSGCTDVNVTYVEA